MPPPASRRRCRRPGEDAWPSGAGGRPATPSEPGGVRRLPAGGRAIRTGTAAAVLAEPPGTTRSRGREGPAWRPADGRGTGPAARRLTQRGRPGPPRRAGACRDTPRRRGPDRAVRDAARAGRRPLPRRGARVHPPGRAGSARGSGRRAGVGAVGPGSRRRLRDARGSGPGRGGAGRSGPAARGRAARPAHHDGRRRAGALVRRGAATRRRSWRRSHWAEGRGLPLRVLGGGSNLVVADAGVDGLVLRVALRGLAAREAGSAVELTAAAGEPWDDVVRFAVERGWAGLECLSGIPGLVGATPIQNVGAYGQEVSDTVAAVRVLDRADPDGRDAPAGGVRVRLP